MENIFLLVFILNTDFLIIWKRLIFKLILISWLQTNLLKFFLIQY